MNRDPQLLLSIQMALIGVVVVVGFFYVWRWLSRLEARVEELASQECNRIHASCAPFHRASIASGGADVGSEEEEDEYYEDEMSAMRSCFPLQSMLDDAAATLMLFKEEEDPKEGLLLEELQASASVPSPPPPPASSDAQSESSHAETESNEYSRNKLRKMNVDALRELCSSRGLSTDGTKATMIERILASFP